MKATVRRMDPITILAYAVFIPLILDAKLDTNGSKDVVEIWNIDAFTLHTKYGFITWDKKAYIVGNGSPLKSKSS